MVTVSKKIRDKILSDGDLSLKGATLLGVKQSSFERLARRNSEKLCYYSLVQLYKESGFSEAEIFEPETEKA